MKRCGHTVKKHTRNECCGVLLGKNIPGEQNNPTAINQVQHIVRAGNTRTDSAHNRYNRPAGAGKDSAAGARPRIGHRRLLPLTPGSPRAVVANRLRRSSLAELLLRHHQCRAGQGRDHELLPAGWNGERKTRNSKTNPSKSPSPTRRQRSCGVQRERSGMKIHIPTPLRNLHWRQ